MNNYLLGQYEKSMPHSLSIREKLCKVKEIGFDFLEMSIDESDEKLARLKFDKKQRLDIIQAMYEIDVKILTMCLSGNRKYPLGSKNKEIRDKGMQIMKDAIDLAADLGIRIVQIAGYDEYYNPSDDETKDLFLRNIKINAEYAAKKGVIIAFETMETEFMNTIQKLKEVIDRINSPYLKIYPDLGNLTNSAIKYGLKVEDDLLSGNGDIVAIHLKETKPEIFRKVKFGTGHVEFEKCIKVAKEVGIRLFLAEFWDLGDNSWEDHAKHSHEFLREKLDKVFMDN